jgi:RHS repeat-associated protein
VDIRITTTTTGYQVLQANGVAVAQTQQAETVVEEDTAPSIIAPLQAQILSDTKTKYFYDSFNNLKARTTTFQNGETRTYSAKYTQNTAGQKYLLSLLQTTKETSTVLGQPAVTRSHAYDPDPNTGLLKDETIQPGGDPTQQRLVTYDRNEFGQVTHVSSSVADPLGIQGQIVREAWMGYDPSDGTFPSTVTNALGQVTRTLFHPSLGALVFTEDANFVTNHAKYDGFGRLRSRSTDGQLGASVSYQPGNPYLSTPGVAGLYTIVANDTMGGSTIATYDALGNEVTRATKNHDDQYTFVRTVYRELPGQILEVTRPFVGAPAPTLPSTSYQYDALGRVTQQMLPDNSSVQMFYNGLATTFVDPNGHARTRIVDDRGRIVQVDEDSTKGDTSDPTQSASSSNATVVTTQYAYGPFDVVNSVGIRPRGGSAFTTMSSMRYDALGRRTDLIDADRGHSVTQYNAFGEAVTELDANKQTHIFTRDALGRTTVDYSSQDGISTFGWDTAQYGIGRLATATSSDNVTSTYAYDVFGRSIETKWHITGTDFAIDRVLTADGRLQTLQYPAVGTQRFSVTYGFDHIGQVSRLTGSDTSAPLIWAIASWETDGQIHAEDVNDGEETVRKHDPLRGWVTDIATASASAPVQELHFDHDADGNLSGREDQLLGTSETFGYDFLDRIQTWGFTSAAGAWSTTYKIDDFGNFQSRTMTGPGAPAAQNYQQYGSRDGTGANDAAFGLHAVTSINGSSYGYDSEGNQLTAPGRTVTYTSFGLPKKVIANGKTTKFTYDANHQRVLKKGPKPSSTLYAGGLYEKRTDSSGNVTHVFFVPGAGRIVAQLEWPADSSGNVTGHNLVYFHDDHVGSIESVTGPSTTTTHLKYEPFGQRIAPTNPTQTAQAPADVTDGFTDQQHDDELGLINMQGRIYDPAIARFASADPFVSAPLSSQGFNRYSYVVNNPLSLVDPNGFAGVDLRPCRFDITTGNAVCQAGTPGREYDPNAALWANANGQQGTDPSTSDWTAVGTSDSNGSLSSDGSSGPARLAIDFAVPASVAETGDQAAIAMCEANPCAELATVVAKPFDWASYIINTALDQIQAVALAKMWYRSLQVSHQPTTRYYNPPLEDDATGNALAASVAGGVGSGLRNAAGALIETTATEAAAQKIALGLGDTLEEFARQTGGSTWKQWAADDPLNWKTAFQEVVGNPANEVNVNLTGVDSPWAAAARAARGAGGATDWELLQIQQNQGWWGRITFWNNGQVVPNPYQ